MKTEIAYILDRSGSMACIWDDAFNGLNAFIEEQKKIDGECRFTLTVFDTNFDVLIDGRDLHVEVEPLHSSRVFPRGCTALLDAIGKTVYLLKARLAAQAAKPDKVIVVIMTDGFENASREYNKAGIKTLIDGLQNDEGWEFMFVGVGIDVFAEARTLGANDINILNVSKDSAGLATGQSFASCNTTAYRTGEAPPEKKEAHSDAK